jgi:bacteriocin-like protein
MLKNILKLEGAQKLNKNELKEISGGIFPRTDFCGYRVVSASSESACLRFGVDLRPMWLGNGRCSILGTGTDC